MLTGKVLDFRGDLKIKKFLMITEFKIPGEAHCRKPVEAFYH